MIEKIKDLKRYIEYKYYKKHRYIWAYTQDIIAEKTKLTPYKIILLQAKKSNYKVHNELDTFTFIYEGKYYLLDKKNKLHQYTKDTLPDI